MNNSLENPDRTFSTLSSMVESTSIIAGGASVTSISTRITASQDKDFCNSIDYKCCVLDPGRNILIVLRLNKGFPFYSDSCVCTRQGICSTLTISRSGGCQEGQQAVGQGPAKLVKLRLTARGQRGRGWTSHYGRTARTRRGPCLVWSRPTN